MINLLKSLEASLNVKTELREDQVFEIVIELTREFRTLTLDEFVYCFRKAKLGHYGKDYNRMDILTISTWLRDYQFSSERTTKLKELEQQKREQELSKKEVVNPPKEFYDQLKKETEKIADKIKIHNQNRKQLSQDDFHKKLQSEIIYYNKETLTELINDARKQQDVKALEIIQAEIESRA